MPAISGLPCSGEESVAARPHIAHVGIAVHDLATALAFYRDILGLEPHPPEMVDGAIIRSLSLGDSEIELLAPTDPDGPVGKFLARRGPGDPPYLFPCPRPGRGVDRLRGRGVSPHRRVPPPRSRRAAHCLCASQSNRRNPARAH